MNAYCGLCGGFHRDTTGGCMPVQLTVPALVPYKCPVCDGTGLTYTPPWVTAGGSWVGAILETYPCKACSGTCVVWRTT